MSVRHTGDQTFVVESRTLLLELGEQYIARVRRRSYDVDGSGERFLFVRDSPFAAGGEETGEGDAILVQNWFTELRERLGEGRR